MPITESQIFVKYPEKYVMKGGKMRFIDFWKLEIFELPITDRIFFRDAISTLQTWKIVKKEYPELELIKKILEDEINIR